MINAEFVQVGAIIDYKVDNAVGYHEAVVIGDILGVTRKSGKKGDIVACDIEGVFRIKKKQAKKLNKVKHVTLPQTALQEQKQVQNLNVFQLKMLHQNKKRY